MIPKIKTFSYLFLFLLVIGILIPPADAAPPETQIFIGLTEGYEIEFSKFNVFKVNEPHEFNFHVVNFTTGHLLNSESTSCEMDIYNSTGNHIYDNKSLNFNEDSTDFEVVVPATIFNKVGSYSFITHCNNTRIGGFVSSPFEVNPSGIHDLDNKPTALIILVTSIAFLLLYLAISLREEHIILSMLLILFSLLLLIVSTNIFSAIADSTVSTTLQSAADRIQNVMIVLFVLVMFYIVVNFIMQLLWEKKEGLGGNMGG